MDDTTETHEERRKRTRLLERLSLMVTTGRISEQEARRLRAASGPGEFESALRDVRVRHAGPKLREAVAEGRLTQAEADALIERLRVGEHTRALRDHVRGLRPGG